MHSKDTLQSTCKLSGWPWGSWTSWWFYFTNFTYGFRCVRRNQALRFGVAVSANLILLTGTLIITIQVSSRDDV